MIKSILLAAALVAATATAQAGDQTAAFIDVEENHRCRNSHQAYVITKEHDLSYAYSGFEPYPQARKRYLKRINGNNPPLSAEIRCDMTPYQPTRD